MRRITIDEATNGFIVRDGSDGTVEVFYDDPKSWAEMLAYLRDRLGMVGSRYDKERVYIEVGPGDKYMEEWQ